MSFLCIETKKKERFWPFNAAVCAFNVFTCKVRKKLVTISRGGGGLKESCKHVLVLELPRVVIFFIINHVVEIYVYFK